MTVLSNARASQRGGTHASAARAVAAWLALAAAGPSALFGCGDAACESAGRTFPSGSMWTCQDGCNACLCEDGAVTSTRIGCGGDPGPHANKLSCKDDGFWHADGESWQCADPCVVCSCNDGRIEADESQCTTGGAGNAP